MSNGVPVVSDNTEWLEEKPAERKHRHREALSWAAGTLLSLLILVFVLILAQGKATEETPLPPEPSAQALNNSMAFGMVLVDVETEAEALEYRVENQGVYVLAVTEESLADNADLASGDFILAINGQPVANVDALNDVLAALDRDEGVRLTVRRYGQEIELSL